MHDRKRATVRAGIVLMLALSALLTSGCSAEVQQTILTAAESGLKTIVDGLISALFVAFSSSGGAF